MKNGLLNKYTREICDRMTGAPHFPCKYPDCRCGETDKAVVAAKDRITRELSGGRGE